MSVADCDKQLFHAACEKVMRQQCPQKGIGTLSEKTVHAVLKNFYETDPAHQEIPVENYVADILRDGEIIEIQTRSLNAMRRKLDCFLSLIRSRSFILLYIPNGSAGSTSRPAK